MSTAWVGGSTWAWRKTRAQVLERDNHRCQVQLPGCTTHATTAHHTLGRAVSGDSPAHIVAACEHCNQQVGDPRSHDPKPKPRTQW